jgi:hypothetical protein
MLIAFRIALLTTTFIRTTWSCYTTTWTWNYLPLLPVQTDASFLFVLIFHFEIKITSYSTRTYLLLLLYYYTTSLSAAFSSVQTPSSPRIKIQDSRTGRVVLGEEGNLDWRSFRRSWQPSPVASSLCLVALANEEGDVYRYRTVRT